MKVLALLFALYAELALGARVEPVYTFEVEFTAGSFTNISSRFERGTWSSNIVDMFRAPEVGFGLFQLANDDGQLSPRNNANVRPGKAVRLTATHGGSEFALFFGRITDVSQSPVLGARTALFECADDWERVQRINYNTGLFVNTKVQSVFCALMSLSGVRSFSADSDISDSVGFDWYRDRDAISALHGLIQSGAYQMVVDGFGTYYLRGRYWQNFATAVGTYSTGDDFKTSYSQDTVINRAKFNSDPRRLTSDIRTLAYLSDAPVFVAASDAIGAWFTYQDPNEPSEATPVSSIITPANSTDFYGAQNSDGTGTNLTSVISVSLTSFAATAVASIFNGGGTGLWLTRFQIRGYPVERVPPIGARYDVASSQDVFGVRDLTVENSSIQDRLFMEQLAKYIAGDRHNGREEASLVLTNEFPDTCRNDVGDVVSVVDTFSGYTTQWRVRGFNHELDLQKGLRHSVTYDLENFESIPWLVLDHSTFGVLDNNRQLAI